MEMALFLLLLLLLLVASLVAQKVKNPPAMQQTWVRSLVQEDPTCLGATKPLHYSY